MQSTLSTLVLAAMLAATAPAQSLADVVRRAEAVGIRTGVAAADVDDGQRFAARRAAEPFIPASNQKLVTAAAFLDALGTDYRFRTGVQVREGVLEVRAGGDPNWITGGDHDPARNWAKIAESLREAGVRSLRRVVLDAGPFRGPVRPAGWPSDQLERSYCAPTGGLVVDSGLWVVEVSDGGDHDALVRLTAPPGGFRLTGRIVLTADRKKGGVYGMRVRGGDLRLWGHFLRGAGSRVERGATDDPAAVFRRVAERQLADQGIGIDPAAPAVDVAPSELATPLAGSLRRTLAHSSNFDAEQLLRVLGAELRDDGSFDGGASAVSAQIESLCGPWPEGCAVVDGSGLSRGNRITPAFVVDVLIAAAHAPWSESFVGALPRPGEDGTLRRRFKSSSIAAAVRAKTGTLNGVSALSGYVRAADGRLLAFAILMNWTRKSGRGSPRELQEAIVEALAG